MYYLLVIITVKSQFYDGTNFFLLKGAFFLLSECGPYFSSLLFKLIHDESLSKKKKEKKNQNRKNSSTMEKKEKK